MSAQQRTPRLALAAGVAVAVLVAVVAGNAFAKGKGSDIGGPPRGDAHSDRSRFGIDPAALSDAEKAERLDVIKKEYESLKRNQDVPQVRTRYNRVVFTGEMHYAAAGPFLLDVMADDRDTRTRVAAQIAVGKSGDLDSIVSAVKSAISDAKKQPVFASALPRMFEFVTDEEARKWIVTRLDQRDDDVLASVVEAVGHAAVPEALPALDKLLAKSKDAAVRFECLRAYGRCGGTAAVPKLISFLADADWRMRMAAVEGLGYAGAPEAIEQIRALVARGEEPIVIETAIEAIGRLGTKDAVDPLIEGLRVGRLRARQKARTALRGIARDEFRMEKDYNVDPNSWAKWWNKVKLGVDPDDPQFDDSDTASYFHFPIHSDRVLFILDVSGSMKWPDAPRESGIKPAAWDRRRIDLAQRELFKALRALAKQNQGRIPEKAKKGDTTDLPDAPSAEGVEPPTLFNLATFAGVVTAWKPESVLATTENVEEGIAWISRQLPRGGTATFDALEFGVLHENVDTIYFLSDGVPSLGRFVEPEAILSELRKVNRFRRVSINTIALIVGLSPIESARKYEDPEDMADLMSRIAAENQGHFANESRL